MSGTNHLTPTAETTQSPSSSTSPFTNASSLTRHSSNRTTAPAATASPNTVATNSVRAPNVAKRVLRDPADELRSAVNRDAIRKEAKKATRSDQPGVQRNVSAPILTAPPHNTPPASPTMTTSSKQPPTRIDPLSIMPRNPSIDSTVSSASNNSARVNASGPYRPSPESTRPEDVAGLIADAGSPEAAILKLIHDKNQAASHNAQLWRLVEKQRSMILGLNKDLEKALKEKEKYRRKVKDSLIHSESAPSLGTANQQLEKLVTRGESQSPLVIENEPLAINTAVRDTSIDSRKVSDTSDMASSGPGRSDTPLEASNAPSSVLPATPQSAESTNQIMRDIELTAAAAASAQEHRAVPQSPTKSPPLLQGTGSPQIPPAGHKKTPSISSTASNPATAASFSTTKAQASRKAPPAPLKLSSQRAAEAAAAAKVTNNIIDPSDSEYEQDPDSARAEKSARGRRKTREEDDRKREVIAQQELEQRSLSKKDRKSRSQPAAEAPDPPPHASTSTSTTSDATAPEGTVERSTNTSIDKGSKDPSAIVQQQAVAAGPDPLSRSSTAPSLLSPGLPMSPRPIDRPMNSPMPRAPNKLLNSIPMSPKSGMAGLPLSPRAPRQPLPMPPQSSLSISSPHLTRAEGYQTTHPQSSALAKEVASSPHASPMHEHASRSIDSVPMTPGEIYQGLVTDEYPNLLLPPNALPSIYIKTASSRMKPSRQSYLAPKTADDNPVFTLAVYERSEKKQLWRVEKTFAALAQLDEEIKTICRFRERVPDKILFNGHAPARIDARRAAIDTYFNRMLESVTDDNAAMVVCKFLSNDAIGADGGDYFGSVDLRSDTPMSKRPRREGYLTKRGKNFGGWKARYFVLDGPILRYYDALGGTQLSSIKLQNAQIGKQSNSTQTPHEDEEHQFRHAFLILEPKKKDSASLVRHVLCAESDEERDLWVDALLQYVDFKDGSEDGMDKSMLLPKADSGPPRSPRLQRSLNDLRPPSRSREMPRPGLDELRAVGYNDTIAGEAPVMGPPSPRIPDNPSPPHDGNFGPAVGAAELPASNHPNISGPTNLHVISNAGDWGMKPPPTPQNKDKKRSIFPGFRGRSSSDLGPSDKLDQINRGGSRAVFGAPLEDAVTFARPADVATELPAVVYRCIEYLLSQNVMAEEGIFRLSGSNTVIKGLKDRFNTEGDVNLIDDGNYYDIHAIASLLKLYLRELPSSILTRDLHLEFLSCQEKHGRDKVVALNTLVSRLPRPNRALLETLSSFLLSIVSNAEVNKMNIRNGKYKSAPLNAISKD